MSYEQSQMVSINAGLWLEDPDVDAITRLSLSPRCQSFKGHSVVLSQDTWSPINTQNTALTREAAQAYYYVRMGHPIQNIKIDRYGDILSGYFVQKCAKHLGHAIRFGTPICDHKRTPHDLMQDIYQELAGMMLIEELLPWLVELKIEGSTYLEAYECLANRLGEACAHFKGSMWNDGGEQFLRATSENMKTWISAVKKLN